MRVRGDGPFALGWGRRAAPWLAAVLAACGPSTSPSSGTDGGTGGDRGSDADDGTPSGSGSSGAASTGRVDMSTSSAGTTVAADDSGGETTGGAVDCDAYRYRITLEQLESTPREDRDAEIIAMLHSGEIVAPDDLYALVHADLDAVRLAEPEFADHPADLPWSVLAGMYLAFDDEGRAELDAGTYHAWDCANERYGVEVDLMGGFLGEDVDLFFPEDKLFHLEIVLDEYLQFPHIMYGETPIDGAIYADEYICFAPGRDENRYLFGVRPDDSEGIEHWFDFGVDSEGVVTPYGEYDQFPVDSWDAPCWRPRPPR